MRGQSGHQDLLYVRRPHWDSAGSNPAMSDMFNE